MSKISVDLDGEHMATFFITGVNSKIASLRMVELAIVRIQTKL